MPQRTLSPLQIIREQLPRFWDEPQAAEMREFFSKKTPIALTRGAVAGALGMPGDLESLVRMIPGLQRERTLSDLVREGQGIPQRETILPTTEEVERFLPGAQYNQSPMGKALTTVGELGGGLYNGPAAPIRFFTGIPAASRKAARDFALSAGKPSVNVVKPKGGNWLSGSVEDALKGLKPRVNTIEETPKVLAAHGLTQEQLLAIPREERVKLYEPFLTPENRAALGLESWIDKQLTRYVKNEMGTPEDPVRALIQERRISHLPLEDLQEGASWLPEDVAAHRRLAGFPEEGLATDPAARGWEVAADTMIRPSRAGDLLQQADRYRAEELLHKDPWLAKVPPETPVHRLYPDTHDLGFSHLLDELRNATNPNSGLPRELLLKYESLPQVSVPQAVERVAKINEWRAAQKAEADLARANNAATVLHKEYPDAGFKWVELKAAERNADTEKALQDALKYEGDTMGHCVGGYCPDVLEGRSRIFSLRSAKGEPHVTIEVQPSDWYRQMKNRSIDDSKLFNAQFKAKLAEAGLDPKGQGPEATNLGNAVYAELFGSAPQPTIVQIKGKQNRAPNPEYLPYVQDFVKSGQWSDVGDLSNTGLRRTRDAWNENELGKILSAGHEVPEYLTPQEIQVIGEKVWPGQWGDVTKYASGGSVTTQTDYDPQRIDVIVEQLRGELAAH